MMLASIFKVMCHLHHTRFHFPVVCRLLAKVFQAQLEGKKNAEVNGMPTGPVLGLRPVKQGTLCEQLKNTVVQGNQADNESQA